MNEPDDPSQPGRDRVALAMAITLGAAVIIFTVAILYGALMDATKGISENATQVLTGVFGGIVGALAVYLGGRLSRTDTTTTRQPRDEDRPE